MVKLFDFVILVSYLLKIGISIPAPASGQQASLLCPSHSTTNPAASEDLGDKAPACTDWRKKRMVGPLAGQPHSLSPRSRVLPEPLFHPSQP